MRVLYSLGITENTKPGAPSIYFELMPNDKTDPRFVDGSQGIPDGELLLRTTTDIEGAQIIYDYMLGNKYTFEKYYNLFACTGWSYEEGWHFMYEVTALSDDLNSRNIDHYDCNGEYYDCGDDLDEISPSVIELSNLKKFKNDLDNKKRNVRSYLTFLKLHIS